MKIELQRDALLYFTFFHDTLSCMTAESPPKNIQELLIASVTPQNIERGSLWFSENVLSIKRAQHTNPWWRENIYTIERDASIKPSECMRKILDLGYERTQTARYRGTVALRGGIIEVWPVNTEKPYLIEFSGNTIATLEERPDILEIKQPRVSAARSIESLRDGHYVVHVDHGIGIFRGAQKDFFIIEYAAPRHGANPDRLLVPKHHKNRISPYIGFETPTIHRLGGSLWHTTKKKIREDTEKLARELLELYAKRKDAERPPLVGDMALEEKLAQTFPYRETPDQLRAEKEILHDLEQKTPMDRVLAGDVGFGKTEVALRAALRVIASGKQVALLAPTTILAEQHAVTFRERLNALPVSIHTLSRLTNPTQEKDIVEKISNGSADCVIGTHRLFSKDITFKNLGLVIIDEEQRFGVQQKERFKKFRSDVDILSLSATPIPRTMYLALSGIRDISRISSPPPDRLPIQTHVLPHSPSIIRDAIAYEISRGGQVYFLHNRIETIRAIQQKLQKILNAQRSTLNPRIGIIHGRMKEKELARVMENFRKKEIDILLATTIIENGLDISSANTLIVDDATRLGLAQAHQLRGRIGRGSQRGFAYFLFRPNRLTEKAEERLHALQEYSELGAGYEIALRDLEIRGAGNVLGREQSGAVNKVGLNLYCQILSETVEKLKSNI